MRRIHIVEDLCNGCRLCQTFCSSLEAGVFGDSGRIRVVRQPGGEGQTLQVDCDGACLRPAFDGETPTCVSVCPTGALFFASPEEALSLRQQLEEARQSHALFKVIAPWKWPFPWNKPAANPADASLPPRSAQPCRGQR